MADPHDATAHTLTTHTHTHAATTGQGVNDHHVEDHDHDGTPTQTLLASRTHGSPSEDTHHTKNHTMAEHEAMGQMIVVRKTADETISLNQISQNDDHLFFSIAANEIWAVQFQLIVNSGTVPDFKYQLAAPAGATGWIAQMGIAAVVVTLNTDSANVAQFAADRLTPLVGIVVNSTTAGTVQLMWAQNLLDAGNTVVKANSYLIAHRIA